MRMANYFVTGTRFQGQWWNLDSMIKELMSINLPAMGIMDTKILK